MTLRNWPKRCRLPWIKGIYTYFDELKLVIHGLYLKPISTQLDAVHFLDYEVIFHMPNIRRLSDFEPFPTNLWEKPLLARRIGKRVFPLIYKRVIICKQNLDYGFGGVEPVVGEGVELVFELFFVFWLGGVLGRVGVYWGGLGEGDLVAEMEHGFESNEELLWGGSWLWDGGLWLHGFVFIAFPVISISIEHFNLFINLLFFNKINYYLSPNLKPLKKL